MANHSAYGTSPIALLHIARIDSPVISYHSEVGKRLNPSASVLVFPGRYFISKLKLARSANQRWPIASSFVVVNA